MYSVYKHTSPSKKVYIGITSQNINKRWLYGYGYICNNHFSNAIKKYGWDKFEHEIICENLTKEQACTAEIELIAYYNANDPEFGYNLSSGGESGSGVKCTDQKKEKIRNSRLGEKHWFYGKHLSEEHRRKIGEKIKGKSVSEETKLKQKAIATKLRGKSVICVETDIIYPSTAEAARLTNINRTGIIHVLRGKRKTAGGYHWEYLG